MKPLSYKQLEQASPGTWVKDHELNVYIRTKDCLNNHFDGMYINIFTGETVHLSKIKEAYYTSPFETMF